ncbi:unnamed protein product, partial [Ixodes hexagonus]
MGASQWMPRPFRCPPRSQLSPCLCLEKSKGLDVTCERVDRIERVRTALSGLADAQHTVLYLRLKHDRLDRFPPGLLDGLEILHLLVHHSNVSEIHLDAFRGVGDKLESLDMSQNALEEVIPMEKEQVKPDFHLLNLWARRLRAQQAYKKGGRTLHLRIVFNSNSQSPTHFRLTPTRGDQIYRCNCFSGFLSQIPSFFIYSVISAFRELIERIAISSVSPTHIVSKLKGLRFFESRGLSLVPYRFILLTFPFLSVSNYGVVHLILFLHSTMEWLKLGHNSLSAVPSEALQNLTALRELDLRDNNISFVHGDAFAGYGTSLKFVYLQKNRLQSIEPGAFDRLHSLEWLYLHSNEISTLHYSVFLPVLDTLSILDVHG